MWKLLNRREQIQFWWLSVWVAVLSTADIMALAMLVIVLHFFQSPNSIPVDLRAFFENGPILIAGILLLVFMIKNILALLLIRKQDQFSSRVATRISRERLYSYLHGSFEAYIETDSSSLIRKVNLEPFEFAQQVLGGWQQIITQAFLVIISITAILLYNYQLFLLLFLFIFPPALLVFYLLRKKIGQAKKGVRESNEVSYKYLLEASKGYVESGIYQRHEFFIDRFIRKRKEFSELLFRSLSYQQFPSRLMEIFAIGGLFILLIVASRMGNKINDLLVITGAFFAGAYKIIPGLVRIINLSGQVRSFNSDLKEWSVHEKEITQPDANSIVPIRQVDLEMLSLAYNGRPVFKGLDLSIRSGEIIAIGGTSGIGKTSLINLLLGNLEPANGRIRINGESLPPASLRAYWPRISYVRQDSFLIQDSIGRNITLEEKPSSPERLRSALQICGLGRYEEQRMDEELLLEENGKNISGGQKQRIAIARALYKEADLLIMDEPFNELDQVSVSEIMNALKEWSGNGKMILLVTHQQELIKKCDKILLLHESN